MTGSKAQKAASVLLIAAVILCAFASANWTVANAKAETTNVYHTPYWKWENPSDVRTRKMYALHDVAEQLRAAGYANDSDIVKAVSAEWWKQKADLDMIAKAVYTTVGVNDIGDAGSEAQQNAMNHVAQVVLNRAADSRYPGTVHGVLTSGLYATDNTTGFDSVPLECYFAAVTAMDGNTGIPSDVVYQSLRYPETYQIESTFYFRNGTALIFCR